LLLPLLLLNIMLLLLHLKHPCYLRTCSNTLVTHLLLLPLLLLSLMLLLHLNHARSAAHL
jgi:hypothetical protein